MDAERIREMAARGDKLRIRAGIIRAIHAERDHQDRKHPVFPDHDASRANILVEEVGEVSKAINHLTELNLTSTEYTRELRAELVQVAAVAVRWLELLPEE